MSTAKITSKGQVTIPKDIRDVLGLNTGDRVGFFTREDGVVEMRPQTLDAMTLFGTLQPKSRGVTVEDMNKVIRKRGSKK